MANFSVSQRLKSRRLFLVVFSIAFIIILFAVGVFFAFKGKKTAQAVDFFATIDQLVVPENHLLYVGGFGYPSQRLYSRIGTPLSAVADLPQPPNPPNNSVYNTANMGDNFPCNPGINEAWGQDFIACHYIVGMNTGMILRYAHSIQIYGTVVVNDRVVFDAPDIIIGRTARIFASGQDSQAGYADNECGTGGIGGINGGTNAENLNVFNTRNVDITVSVTPGSNIYGVENSTTSFPRCRGAETAGGPSTDLNFPDVASKNLSEMNNDVLPFFTYAGQPVVGGNGSKGSLPIETHQNTGSGFGAVATVGVGGGGSSGSTGSTAIDDHASSGGGGGGFGLVFKTTVLTVSSSSIITAAGGNSLASSIGTAVYSDGSPDSSGGFGGPGGGGVIIIDAATVNFKKDICRYNFLGVCQYGEVESEPNFSIFNVKAGSLVFPQEYDIRLAGPDDTIKIPPGAEDGKLVILSEVGKNISIRKSIKKLIGSGSPYSVQPGDVLEVTLQVSNLVVGQGVTIKDEMFNDAGVNFSTFRSCSDSCLPPSGTEITWVLDPTSTTKTLTYQIEIR